MTDVACDVLVVGSGAAGATLAATLVERSGLHVVLVEKGAYYGAEFFNQRELDMTVLLAERGGRATGDGAMPFAGGACVGGGTTVNYALSFDPVRSMWERWRRDYGVRGFSFDPSADDYGVEGLNLATCARDVKVRCNVHEPRDDEVNENNRLFHAGCSKLGITARKFQLNMRGCIGCGFCGQGCAYDAKRGTMVTYLQDAFAGGVQLIHHCSIDTLALEPGADRPRVVGASGTIAPTAPGSRPNTVAPGPITFKARLVVVAAGSIESPALLQRSQHPDPHDRIGRGLIAHPSLPIAALFDHPIHGERGITGSYYSDHFYDRYGFVLECLFDHPIDAAIAIPGFGAAHYGRMRNFSRTAGLGVMLVDTPNDENRVRWNRATGKADISYRVVAEDKPRLRVGAQKAVEIMFAAGAREVLLSSNEPILPGEEVARFTRATQADACNRLQFVPNQTLLSSAHCQATVKMSEDPSKGVVDSRGESHGVANLIVCDSSAFPTSCGANPMISIMSMARYQGKRIVGERGRYFAS